MRILTIVCAIASLSATMAIGQDKPNAPAPAAEQPSIAPPGDLNLEVPAPEEVVPAPDGRRQGRDLDLGQLRKEFGPQGRRFLERNGDRGISFGLDMAGRGINFGMRWAGGHASPDDARAFGSDMRRRGKAFGIEMRDRAIDEVDGHLGEATRRLPVDARDKAFKETPGDITIESPPIPLGVNTVRPRAESKVYGRQPTSRPVKFRREF